MTLETIARQLALALARACREHGTPNSFSPGELEAYYGGPPAALAGRVADRLCRDGRLTYVQRRFYVLDDVTPD